MYDKCDGEPSFPGVFFVSGESIRQQQHKHCCSEELSHVRSFRRREWKYPVIHRVCKRFAVKRITTSANLYYRRNNELAEYLLRSSWRYDRAQAVQAEWLIALSYVNTSGTVSHSSTERHHQHHNLLLKACNSLLGMRNGPPAQLVHCAINPRTRSIEK